jgi:hypothetical protein
VLRGRILSGLALAWLIVPLLAVFAGVLLGGEQFAFQDAGHYYYPLLRRVQQEWEAGRWPLWAAEASAGTPLLGNPTAAVLYPGKLVFFLLPHPWAMRLFVIGHVALAFVTLWVLMRGWGVSAAGSTLSALAYAFGVPVLSQTSNVIFLVGAAWAPLGLLAADRWVRCRRRSAVPALAVVLTLQLLGGDPEAAYVTVISAAGYAVGLTVAGRPRPVGRVLLGITAGLIAAYLALLGLAWWSARARYGASVALPGTSSPWKPPKEALVAVPWAIGASYLAWRAWSQVRDRGRVRGLVAILGGLIVAASLTLAISGAQLLPILEYSAMSFRAAEAEGFHDIYPYSAHPLQFLDALWPNAFGTLEGGYRSWLNALPPKPGSRLWMPSVYLGGLTLALTSAAAGFRGGPPWRALLSALALVSLLAALGYHGSPLLWARCAPGGESLLGPREPPFTWQVRGDGHLRDGDGGVYWFLASALPGFRSFRYPPKLLVFWALAVSGLAGAGWDRLVAGGGRRARAFAAGLALVSLAALSATWAGTGPLRAGFDRLAESLRSSDEPLDVARALADLRVALGHGAVVGAAALGLCGLAARRPVLAGVLAVAGLTLDLAAANAYHVVTVPQSAFEGTPRALEQIREAERANPSPGPFRIQRVGRWWPARWPADGSPRDFETITRWERHSLRPLHGLPLGLRSTFYFDTIEPLDYGLFFLPWSLVPDEVTARAHGLKPGQKVWYYPRRGFDLWNTRYFIVPGRLVWDSTARGYAACVPRSTILYPPPGAFNGPDGPMRRTLWEETEDFRILRNDAAFPRAWVVHRAYLVPPVHGLGVADRAERMQEILYQEDEFWRLPGTPVRDPRVVAWIETDRPKEVDESLSRALPDPAETVTLTREDPQHLQFAAVLRSPGLVVISDLFYPGWKVTVDGRPAEILRTNRAMRGVALPAGTHRLAFHYNPLSFRVGVTLSFVGLGSLAMVILRAHRESLREGGEPPG